MTFDPANTAARECRTCRRLLEPAQFWRQPNKRNGLQSECKTCMKGRTTAYHRTHRDELRPRNNAVITARRRRDPLKAFMASIRNRAKVRGLPCTITEDDLVFPERCPILGIPLSFGLGMGAGHGLAFRDSRYSADRIDNSKGYVPGNVVIVSYRANRIKSDASAQELTAVARFYERLASDKDGQAALSDVQPHEKKEARQMPVRVGDD